MANVKISDLPAAVAAQLAMEFEVNDAGTSRRVTAAQIDTLVLGATNGFVARTGTNARAARTLTAGTGVAVTNGNGASGNPAIALSTAAQASLAKADNAQPAFMLAVLTANASAAKSHHYYLNAVGIVLTLPALPGIGDEVRFTDIAGGNQCVVARNGNLIMGEADDLVLDIPYASMSLRYVNAPLGWAFS